MPKPTIDRSLSWADQMAEDVDNTTQTTLFETEKTDRLTLRATDVPNRFSKWWSDRVDAFIKALWQWKDTIHFNVKDFGAVGDGVADDTDAIQNALQKARDISEANSGPCAPTVFLPAGKYRTTATLRISTYVSLIGAGSGSTEIQNTTTDGIAQVTDSTSNVFGDVYGVRMEGFTIRGPANQTNSLRGFDITGFRESYFHDLRARNHHTGFYLGRAGGRSCFFNTFGDIYAHQVHTGVHLVEDIPNGRPNANVFKGLIYVSNTAAAPHAWGSGCGIDLSGYGNTFNRLQVAHTDADAALIIRSVAGTNQIQFIYGESGATTLINNTANTSGRMNIVYGVHVDAPSLYPVLSDWGDNDLIVFGRDQSNGWNIEEWNQLRVRRQEPGVYLNSTHASGVTYRVMSGGGALVGAGGFAIRNDTNGTIPFQMLANAPNNSIVTRNSGRTAFLNGIGVGGTTTATTPGSVVRRMPIYDANDTLLGYIPIYDSIT